MAACMLPGPSSEALKAGLKEQINDISKPDQDQRERRAFRLHLAIGALQAEALLQEHDADQDAGDKADQTDHGVQVAAAQADDHTQRAAQEHQRADHDEQRPARTAGPGRSRRGP